MMVGRGQDGGGDLVGVSATVDGRGLDVLLHPAAPQPPSPLARFSFRASPPAHSPSELPCHCPLASASVYQSTPHPNVAVSDPGRRRCHLLLPSLMSWWVLRGPGQRVQDTYIWERTLTENAKTYTSIGEVANLLIRAHSSRSFLTGWRMQN